MAMGSIENTRRGSRGIAPPGLGSVGATPTHPRAPIFPGSRCRQQRISVAGRCRLSTVSQADRSLVGMAQFPSMKARKLLRTLQAQPLGYRIIRQKGSHRKMEAPDHPTVVFAFHDNQTIRPSTVKDILCDQVGLSEQDALALL